MSNATARARPRAAARLGPAFRRLGRGASAAGARFRVHAVDLPGHGYSAAECRSPRSTSAPTRSRPSSPRAPRSAAGRWAGSWRSASRARHPRKARALALVSTTPCFVQRHDWPHAMQRGHAGDVRARARTPTPAATLTNFVRLNALNGARGRDAIRAFTARLFERGTPTEGALAATLAWLREYRPAIASASALPAAHTRDPRHARHARTRRSRPLACRGDSRRAGWSSCPMPRTFPSSPTARRS